MQTKNILLLGGVLPVLHLLRRLQRLSVDTEVIANVDDAVAYSKFGVKHLYTSSGSCVQIVDRWIEMNKSERGRWLVIPCSEMFVEHIGMFRNAGFEVFAPTQSALNIFTSKSTFYSYLNKLNIFTDEFFSLKDNLSFNNGERYIVKLSKTSSDFESLFKTAIIASTAEWYEIVNDIPEKFQDNYIIQRFYRENQSISYGSVWENGKEVASIVIQQTRQFPKGVTSAAKLYGHAEDLLLIRDVVKKIADTQILNGFVELEFIKSEHGLVPIDLNPRLWGWSSFLFFNFPDLVKYIALGDGVAPRQIALVSWSNLWRDLPAILRHEGPATEKFKMLLSLLLIRRIEFIYWHDMKPELKALFKKTFQ